uniref:Tropomyosin-1-like n=2 Tax=Nicotiana TaxID=4085 RepID=A0A1S4BFQ8_TOBAC|nr:PREDICTED: tropomyosin-1-like [Nicotiana sylvestris]XP_016487725.1 PREDICTED: tropomyosin-1-like [Nicotiana tabacum]
MKITAENPVRSRKDKKLIHSLRRKVCDYGADLEKTEGELAKAREKLSRNAEERASFVQQLKEKYNKGITGLKEKLNTLENEMAKQTKNFKAEREHCYALMSQLEENLQQLQEQNHTSTQVLEARSKQIGRLLQEKGVIRERIRRIADYIVMKCNECEDMTRSMFFTAVIIFVC